MAGVQENKKSRRTKRKKKGTVNANQNGKDDPSSPREKTATLPRLDIMDKVPSNAPTMAIAPSDYEHIFHEGAGTNANPVIPAPKTNAKPTPPVASPPPAPAPPMMPPLPAQQPTSPPFRGRLMPEPEVQYPAYGRQFGPVEVQATPDGYTLLGHEPDMNNRVALPPYIVRASNQFSRAALARVAKYLASRADPFR